MTDAELLAAACPIIGDVGSSFYFTPETIARGQALGLERGPFYFIGRGGVLGDVDAAVVSSAFGYFNPAVVERVWNAARQQISPRAAGALYMECCADHGRRRLAAVGGLDEFNAAASKVLAHADGDSLALFAGINAEPRATDAPALALQLIAVLREYRGSAHLLALRCVGLNSKIAHLVKRPDMARGFGWSDADMPEVTPAITNALTEAEAITDRIVQPAFASLDTAERHHLVSTLRSVKDALAG
jgi:hypothetical protein